MGKGFKGLLYDDPRRRCESSLFEDSNESSIIPINNIFDSQNLIL